MSTFTYLCHKWHILLQRCPFACSQTRLPQNVSLNIYYVYQSNDAGDPEHASYYSGYHCWVIEATTGAVALSTKPPQLCPPCFSLLNSPSFGSCPCVDLPLSRRLKKASSSLVLIISPALHFLSLSLSSRPSSDIKSTLHVTFMRMCMCVRVILQWLWHRLSLWICKEAAMMCN